MKTAHCLLGGALLAMVAGCSDKQAAPEGQVVATLNGTDITRPELQAELGAPLPEGDAGAPQRNAVLDALIKRKLLAGYAAEQKIDKAPGFVLAQRRASESILAEEALRKATSSASSGGYTTTAENYLARNPQVFNERAVILVDQLQFRPDVKPELGKQITAAKTLDAAQALLAAARSPYFRTWATIDTATLSTDQARRMVALGGEKLFLAPSPAGMTLNRIERVRPVPREPEMAQGLAVRTVNQQEAARQAKSLLDTLRAKAKITYAKGFAPPAEPKSPPVSGPVPAGQPAG